MWSGLPSGCIGRLELAVIAGLTGAVGAPLVIDDVVFAQPPACLVTTANGDVQGVLRGGTCAFLGVPYAAPPVANLRWRLPQPRAPWAPAMLNATTAPPVCPQINLRSPGWQ